MSSIVIVGNVTRVDVLKYSQGGTCYFHFGVAATRKKKDTETTVFYDVTCFGSVAENAAMTLEKGTPSHRGWRAGGRTNL